MKRRAEHPRLTWPGRSAKPGGAVAGRLDVVAEFRPGRIDVPANGRLIAGDNLAVMSAVAAEGLAGKFELIYIDPPFNVGADFRLPGGSRKAAAPAAFSDKWGDNPLAGYLDMLAPRLAAMRELLSDTGTLWIHADYRAIHYIRVLADEVFGPAGFLGEVIWRHQVLGAGNGGLSKMHETLLRYGKTPAAQFNIDAPEVRVPFSDYILKSAKQDADGRWYYERRAVRADDKGRNLKTYFDPAGGKLVGGLWLDLPSYQPPGNEKWGYPTQKPEALLRRITALSSKPGDLVGDFFCGSGTTAAVAADMGRQFVCCDAGDAAVHVALKRLCCRPRPVAFRLERLAGSAGRPLDPVPPVRREGAGRAARLVLGEDSTNLDFVAVDWSGASPTPVYTTVVGRSRRNRALPTEIPAPADLFGGSAEGGSARVMLADGTGVSATVRVD